MTNSNSTRLTVTLLSVPQRDDEGAARHGATGEAAADQSQVQETGRTRVSTACTRSCVTSSPNARRRTRADGARSLSVTKTSGGRKSSVGGLQLTQARYSVTSTSKRGGESDQQRELASVRDEE